MILHCFLLPQMGIADGILDLVSSGTTLRENNLKEIEGGIVLQSQVSSCSYLSWLILYQATVATSLLTLVYEALVSDYLELV